MRPKSWTPLQEPSGGLRAEYGGFVYVDRNMGAHPCTKSSLDKAHPWNPTTQSLRKSSHQCSNAWQAAYWPTASRQVSRSPRAWSCWSLPGVHQLWSHLCRYPDHSAFSAASVFPEHARGAFAGGLEVRSNGDALELLGLHFSED